MLIVKREALEENGMDFSDPSIVISAFLIGMVGMGLFIYGKKSEEPKCLGAGIAMCVFPMFIHSLLVMWALTGLCLAGAWFLPKSG